MKHIDAQHLGQEVSQESAHQQNSKSRAMAGKRLRDEDDVRDALPKARKLSEHEGISPNSAIDVDSYDIHRPKDTTSFNFGQKQ